MFKYTLENGYKDIKYKNEKQMVYIICPIYNKKIHKLSIRGKSQK